MQIIFALNFQKCAAALKSLPGAGLLAQFTGSASRESL
jgi:hypothetical protein